MIRAKTIGIAVMLAVLGVTGCKQQEPVLPAKGVAFSDSLYHSTLVRVSDKTVDHYSSNGVENEYAKADAWNSNGAYLILRGNDGVYYLYDATTYELIRNLDELGGGQELEPRWAAQAPAIFYYLAGSSLKKYDVAASTQQVIHDFKHEFPNCTYITTGVEGDASQDRRYWCLMVTDSVYRLIAACVYDLNLDSVVGSKTSFPGVVNFTTSDASGTHAVICYDTMPMQAFYRDFTHQVDFAHGAMGHSDVALTSDGRDVMVYQNVSTDFISMTDLETGVETRLQAIPFDTNPDIGMHISGNCYTVPGWVLVSTYGARNPPSGKHSWMDNLLYMLELKANPRIVKMAPTHCFTGNSPRSNYFAEAFASVNRAGTKIVFGSNWGVLDPEDYTDAYEVRTPSGWNQ